MTPWLDVWGRRDVPTIRQSTSAECGLACLAMIASWHGAPTDLITLRREYRSSLRGQSLSALVGISQQMGMRARAIRCSINDLRKLRTPCILHWEFDHFVVLVSADRKGIVLNDPARGRVRVPYDAVKAAFTGIALEIQRGPEFESGPPPLRLKLKSIVSRETWAGNQLVAGLLLALVCECLVLVSPFYLQSVIDEVVVSGDTTFLDSLALAFLVLLGFQVAAGAMRALTFQMLSFVATLDLAVRVFDRLVCLPVSWFRSRELGDIQHRFQSLALIQAFIVESAPRLLIDLLFVALLAALLLVYDPLLSVMNFGAIALLAIWRAVLFRYRLRVAGEVAVAEAAMQSHFLESLRGIVSIKHVNGAARRITDYCNRLADTINARVRAGNLRVLDAGVRQTIFNVARIVSVYLLARAILNEQFTVGMLAAYSAYLGMLFARTSAIFDAAFEYRLLRVPLDRLSEIVFSEPENSDACTTTFRSGRVELRGASFRYGQCDAPIIRDCSVVVESGRFIAIAGASGSGKSTLLQLIAGTEHPSSGQVLHDNVSTTQCSPVGLRNHLACVMHDDCLLKGSVMENIALFDDQATADSVRIAAELAQIHDDIMALPMRYQTRIGDMGAALSKGQVQRVLMARAYHRRPSVLLLDEATSGLDPATEKRVVSALKNQSMTRILVTHSDQILEAADEVWWLNDGSLVLSPTAIQHEANNDSQ